MFSVNFWCKTNAINAKQCLYFLILSCSNRGGAKCSIITQAQPRNTICTSKIILFSSTSSWFHDFCIKLVDFYERNLDTTVYVFNINRNSQKQYLSRTKGNQWHLTPKMYFCLKLRKYFTFEGPVRAKLVVTNLSILLQELEVLFGFISQFL